MVNAVPPYLPSPAWYGAWMQNRLMGLDDDRAVAAANRGQGVKGKDYARCMIAVPNGHPELLSVAVAGGAHSLLHRGAELKARLSDHGDWMRVHLSALDTAYGRTPFWPHLRPGIAEVLASPPDTLAALNQRLHRVLADMVTLSAGPVSDTCRARGKELLEGCDKSLSILDTLCRLGPETSLLLLAMQHR